MKNHGQSNPALNRHDVALLVLQIGAAALVLGKGITEGGLRYGDAPAHAMDGVLIHDWIASGPQAWLHPLAFAEKQYAHYPTLGIGRHYPPGFAVVEAGFFGLFGISAVTSRMCVVFFGIIAVVATYFFVRFLADRAAAALAAVALLTLPSTVEWGRDTMLEVPMMAALACGAVAAGAYLRTPTCKRLAWMNAVFIAALFFKQTAVFVFVATALTLGVGALRKAVPSPHAAIQALMSAGVLVVVALSLDGHATHLLRGDATYADRWSWDVGTGYLQIVPRQVGLPILVAATLGIIVLLRNHFLQGVFCCAWFASCWAMLTFSDFKYDRYLFPGLFPFAICASWGVVDAASWMTYAKVRPVAACAAGIALCVNAIAVPVRTRVDLGPVVAAHRERMEGRAVLVSGLREGDVVFAARQQLPWRSTILLRASKLFYSCNGRPNLEFEARAGSRDAVEEMLMQLAPNLILVERHEKTGVPQEQWLREALRAGTNYRTIAEHACTLSPDSSNRQVIVDVFAPTHPTLRASTFVDIPIARANRTVRVELPANSSTQAYE